MRKFLAVFVILSVSSSALATVIQPEIVSVNLLRKLTQSQPVSRAYFARRIQPR